MAKLKIRLFMKKLLILFSAVLILSSCGNKNSKSDANASIDGTVAGLDEATAKLIKYEGREAKTIDSTPVKEGHFQIKAKVDKPEMFYLTVSGVPSDMPLILEPGSNIKVDVDITHMRKSTVVSKGLNKKLYDYFDELKLFSDKQQKLGKLYQAAQNKANEEEKTKIINRYYNIDDERHEYEYKVIEDNKDNLVGAMIFEKVTYDKAEPNYNKLKKIYESFPQEIKNMPNVKNAIQIVNQKSKVSIGSKAPDFSAPTPDGKMLSLKDVLGKVTIIDFWASWCRPCRGENPYVVEIYKKYHPQGLNIISVSLDRPGNKEAWVKAIEQDHLDWYHVSNLKYWQDPIAREYNVRSIPATFVLDKNGVIRAKNLRRDRLEAKVKELLEETN